MYTTYTYVPVLKPNEPLRAGLWSAAAALPALGQRQGLRGLHRHLGRILAQFNLW